MILYWAKVREGAHLPTKREEDAGYDLYPCFEEDFMRFEPFETRMVPLGVASAFEPGYVMFLKERGSTGTKGIAQRSGVIDAGYRGEYLAPITNINRFPLYIAKDHAVKDIKGTAVVYPYEKAICQAVLLESPNPEVQELSMEDLEKIPSLRGAGRLGSSGK